MEQKKLNIGLFGFGVVGEGLYKILKQTPSLNATIKRIVIKHPDKQRNAPPEIFAVVVILPVLLMMLLPKVDNSAVTFELLYDELAMPVN